MTTSFQQLKKEGLKYLEEAESLRGPYRKFLEEELLHQKNKLPAIKLARLYNDWKSKCISLLLKNKKNTLADIFSSRDDVPPNKTLDDIEESYENLFSQENDNLLKNIVNALERRLRTLDDIEDIDEPLKKIEIMKVDTKYRIRLNNSKSFFTNDTLSKGKRIWDILYEIAKNGHASFDSEAKNYFNRKGKKKNPIRSKGFSFESILTRNRSILVPVDGIKIQILKK